MVIVRQVHVSWVVTLVNEYAELPRSVAGEHQAPYPDLPASGVENDLWRQVDHPQLVQLADELHAVFAAAHRNAPVAAALNVVLRRTRPWPQAASGNTDSPDATTWTIDSADAADGLAAAAALCLLRFLAEHGQRRLGLCEAERCVDAYADTSPAGHRRFCSPSCLNRHKVAAHRTRRRLHNG